MGLGFLFVLIYFSTIVEIEKATTDKKEREEKEEGDRGDHDKKRGNQKERDRSSQ